MKGTLKVIPVYRISLNHGQIGGDLSLITDNLSLGTTQNGVVGNPQNGYIERLCFKDNKKDNAKSFFSQSST